MHKTPSQNATVLRKGDYRMVGVALLLGAAFFAFMLFKNDAELWKYLVVLFLGGLGFNMTFSDTSYVLFIDDQMLHWSDHQGKNVFSGSASISDIKRLDAFKVKPFKSQPNKPVRDLAVVLTLRDGSKVRLPHNLGFGGPANPRYEDVLDALRAKNPAILSDVGQAFGDDLKGL